MKPKLLLCLALVLTGGLLGCSTTKFNCSEVSAPGNFSWIAFNGKQLLFRNQLWDVESGKEIRQFATPPQITVSNNVSHGYGFVVAVAFSPGGKRALTVTAQELGPEMTGPGPVQLWDVASGRKLLEFKPDERIDNARFLPDGNRILTASDGQKYPVQIWDAKTGQRLLALRERPVSPYAAQIASFSPDGRLIATEGSAGTSGHYYATVNLRDSFSGRKICTIVDTTNSFFDLALFSPDGKSILTRESILQKDVRGVITNSQPMATLWDVKTGRRIRDFAQDCPMLFMPDGRQIICAGNQCTIHLRDVKSDNAIRQFVIPGFADGWRVDKIALSHDGKRLVVQYIAPTPTGTKIIVALWNTDTGKLIKQFDAGQAMVWSQLVGFSPEGECFLLFDKSGKPALYDGDYGTRLKVLEHFQQP